MKKSVLVSDFKDLRRQFIRFYNGDFYEDLGDEYLLDLVYKNLTDGVCKIVLDSSKSRTYDDVIFEFERVHPFIKYLEFEDYKINKFKEYLSYNSEE
jgi:hypothetical protein